MNIGMRLAGFSVAAAVAGALGSMAVTTGAAASALVQVQNNASPVIGQARYLGHHNPGEVLQISVALSLQNQAQMYTYLHELHDRSSPNYHRYLKPKQFARLYGPSNVQVGEVERFLTQHGIKVTGVTPNNMRVYAKASVATLESAFGVAVNDYKDKDGTTFYAASSDPSLPASIGGLVTAVMGLESAAQLTPHYIQNTSGLVRAPSAATAAPLPAGFSPQQIATAYSWPSLTDTTQASVGGVGVNLAIATAFSFRMQDLKTFWATYGLPAHNVKIIAVNGQPTERLEGETTLDIQRSSAMSPGSNILVYEAVNPGFMTFDQEFQQIANDATNDPQVVSTSWGAAENRTPAASLAAEHASFVQLNMEGIVVLAAAGDNGASDGGSTADNADFPAVDPYVLAAGGTHLVLNPNNTIASEVAWTGAGGADSIYFAEPGYQTDLTSGWTSNTSCTGTFTAAYSAATQTTAGTPNLGADGCASSGTASRQSSDMSMDADPQTGYSLYFNGRWAIFGGTSFVAPELAGLFAVAIAQKGGGSSDSGPFIVYCMAQGHITNSATFNDFNDIVSGSNSNGPGALGGTFNAASGWDHPTGWGSPIASSFIADLNSCEL